MIKKTGYFLLIVLSIVLIVGYFRYNPQLNYLNKIPTSAEVVAHVNLRKIEQDIVFDFLKHPFTYINFKTFTEGEESKNTRKKQVLYRSISIPKSVFFYTNNRSFKNCFISSPIGIKDKKGLEAYLNQENFIKNEYNIAGVYENKSLLFILNKNELILVFKQGEVENKSLVDSILNNTQYLTENNEIVKKLKNSSSIITLVTRKNDFFELNVIEGVLTLRGFFNKKNPVFLPYKATTYDSSILTVSGKLNTKFLSRKITLTQKEKFQKLTRLSLDSVISKWDGTFDFNLSSFKSKIDTVITYEYDDDFNKIEKKAIDKKISPSIELKMANNNLYDYLCTKGAVKNIEGANLLTIMPFFKTVVNFNKSQLVLTTEKQQFKTMVTPNKFTLFFDIEKYKKSMSGIYNFNNKYFTITKNIKASISPSNDVLLSVELKDQSENIFWQLLQAK